MLKIIVASAAALLLSSQAFGATCNGSRLKVEYSEANGGIRDVTVTGFRGNIPVGFNENVNAYCNANVTVCFDPNFRGQAYTWVAENGHWSDTKSWEKCI